VSLSVTDSGIGIAPDAMGRIFEFFQREQASDADGGLGIGLWISRDLVERHGGRIDVFSAGLDRMFRGHHGRRWRRGAAAEHQRTDFSAKLDQPLRDSCIVAGDGSWCSGRLPDVD
jgi:signal transduction histidine kinase